MGETPNDRLRIFRIEELDISQKDMAKTLNIQQGSYSDIERGKVSVSGIMTKLIKTFQINPIWLVDGFGKRRIDDVSLLFHEDKPPYETPSSRESELKEKIFDLIDDILSCEDQRTRQDIALELKSAFGKLLIENNQKLSEISELKSVIIDLLRKRENLKEILKKL